MVAVHPIFISLSSAAYIETLYLPFVAAGIFLGLVAIESSQKL